MLEIQFKDSDSNIKTAYINPDSIIYISGSIDNNTTYIKLRDNGFLFALETVETVLERLRDLY